MKKILIMLIGLTSFVFVHGQSSFNHTTFNPTGTITNTGIDTMSIILGRAYSLVSIQPVIVKTANTMAGKSYLYYSVNGVTTDYTLADSATWTNVARQTHIWQLAKPARYIRIITGGATTVTATTSAKITAGQ